MADNFIANPGTGGDTFAADDVGGIKYPRSKIAWGVDGAATDTTLTNPFPTQAAGWYYPADSGNSSTVQLSAGASFVGTVTATGNFPQAIITVVADQAITITVKSYLDASGTILTSTDTFTRAAGVPFSEAVALPDYYYNVTVTNNGASPTTTLNINSGFGFLNPGARSNSNAGNFKVSLSDVSGTAVTLGQKTLANSIPVAVASDQTVTIQGVQDTSTTGTITSAASTVGPLAVTQRNVVTVTVSGTYAGVSIIIEASDDGGTLWYPLQCIDNNTGQASSTFALAANGAYSYDSAIGGYTHLRVRSTAWTSGTANVRMTAQSFAYDPVVAAIAQSLDVDLTATGVAALNGDLFSVDCKGIRAIYLQITGTFVGTVTFQGSNDGATWSTAQAFNASTGVVATTATAVGIFAIPAHTRFLRARVTAYTSGTVNGVYRLSSFPMSPTGTTQVVSGTVTATVTGYPTAAASADALANPTVTKVDATTLNFNGTSWDRARNNALITMGDTGAKTATFNGATQTNYNARGAYITVAVGAVTGTTPTLACQLQVSYDGTNFINLGPASANITTSTQTCTFIVYPTNLSQSAGATPANLTTGANQTIAINAPLPRTWRIVYTIGGTTPSFTLTNAYAAYVN